MCPQTLSLTGRFGEPQGNHSGTVLSGQGYLNVRNGGSQNGCLISGGTWYTSGTCATYTALPSGKSISHHTFAYSVYPSRYLFHIRVLKKWDANITLNWLKGVGFVLTSSKGKCATLSNVFTCSSSISTGTEFSYDGTNLVYSSSSNFYASSIPTGSQQATVYTTSHSPIIKITWQAK